MCYFLLSYDGQRKRIFKVYNFFRSTPRCPTILSEPPFRVPKNFRSPQPPQYLHPPLPLVILNELSLRWPEKKINIQTSGTKYVPWVTKMLSSCSGTFLRESYRQESIFFIQIGWDVFVYHVRTKINYFGWVCAVITGLIWIFLERQYLWNEKSYLKILNSIYFLAQTFCLCLKMT